MSIVRKTDFLESRFYVDEETFKVTNGHASFLFDVEDLPNNAQLASESEIDDFILYHKLIWKTIEDHLPLCYSIAAKFPDEQSEVLVSDVGIPLMLNALRTFDPMKGTFANWIYRLLHSRYTRHVQLSRREVLLDELPDVISYEHDANTQLDDVDLVSYLIDCLDDEERIMIVMRFWQSKTYEEIALHFDVVKSTVYRTLKRALGKCDKEFKQNFGKTSDHRSTLKSTADHLELSYFSRETAPWVSTSERIAIDCLLRNPNSKMRDR